jgi:hypothetical protein
MTTLNKIRQLTNGLFLLLLLSTGIAWGQSGKVLADSFGMQCGQAQGECKNNGGITLPTVPGLLRLWDSTVDWSHLAPTSTSYDFSLLDVYLNAIHADPSHPAVIYTFGYVPCWAAGQMPNCGNNSIAPNGTNIPPTDLNAQGSVFFNNFVTKLTQHCNSNNFCVKDLIKYYELWNEANADGPHSYWIGTETQLWDMVKPAAGIIDTNVAGAQILTPSVCDNRPGGCEGIDFQTWQQIWLGFEGSYGSPTNISDIYNFHVYLQDETPENRWADTVELMLAARNNPTYGWTSAPWWNTETNYNGNFACNTTGYSEQDCIGQVARWQLLHDSNSGAGNSANLSWYKWNSTIGQNPDPAYAKAYQYLMQYMVGGSFPQPCSPNTLTPATWTCSFTEGGGTSALFVWTPSETGTLTYKVPVGYVDYRDLSGAVFAVTAGELIPISVEPIMLEGEKPLADH